jgi:mono/diheme cytochrome c family protein
MKLHYRIAGSMLLLVVTAACSRHKAGTAVAAPANPLASSSAVPEVAAVEVPLSYEVRLGKETFQHYCKTCHGDTGAGDGFNAFNLDPHPRDLSDPAFQKTKTDGDLRDAIQRGGSGVGLSPLMPPWGRTLSAAQVDEVVLYLRTFKKTEP